MSANECMKRRSASIMRERPIKVMTTYHLTTIKMVTVKENTSVGGKVKKLEPCAMKVAQKINTMWSSNLTWRWVSQGIGSRVSEVFVRPCIIHSSQEVAEAQTWYVREVQYHSTCERKDILTVAPT